MHPLPLLSFFVYISFQVAFIVELNAYNSDSSTESDLSDEWEYEPRIWSSDETELSNDLGSLKIEESALEETIELGEEVPLDFHRVHHFLEQNEFLLKQKKADCTQYRVDTREAIICDKRRCDKFDFEWPKYDNQLTVIETTKQGMRFRKVDYAFAKDQKSSRRESGREFGKDLFDKPFDLFDFLKPKPSSTTTTTTTTTTAATTTTEAPETTASEVTTTPATTTSGSEEATTEMEDTTATTSADEEEATTTVAPATSSSRLVGLNQQDKNTTQLITTFRLSTARQRQKILGFGGALSDSTCRNIKSLSPAMSKSLMEDYFGERGIKYNMIRLTMGSSDFSTSPYTNNDKDLTSRQRVDAGDDVEMNNFRLTSEDHEFKLPVARQAIASSQQEVKFFASLWSPPSWMKNNSNPVHGYLKGDIFGPYYKALAEYMIKWLEAYRKNGIDMWGLTSLNEPVTGVMPFIHHNSLGITKEDYITFYKLYLGPMLRQRGFQGIKLMALDDNKGFAPFWAKPLLNDKEASKYISGIAIHWYMNDEYENLNFLAKDHPDKFILSTEACNGYLPYQVHALPGNWDRGVAYMYDIIKTTQKNSAGWVDWNMALDLSGGPTWAKNNLDAPIIVNAKRDEYYKSPMFYAIGHFSKFVEPDSVRLDYRLANARYDYPVEAVAFYTPLNYIVIVALNSNKHPVPFRVIVDRKLVRIVTLKADSFSTLIFKWKTKSM